MDQEPVEPVTERKVEFDGTSFSKGPSKPVPLQPRIRPASRPKSAPDQTDSNSAKNDEPKNERHSSAEQSFDEVDSNETTKVKKGTFGGLKKLFNKK
uniref:CSON013579 protein n=1 Tax=Culicoides sonorensis TaxID=179676 RepID=A0A336M944_CULSO